MKPDDQIKALAELDGWTDVEFCSADIDGPALYQGKESGVWKECKPYLTSYDAIIPLIQKQADEVIREIYYSFLPDGSFSDSVIAMIRATPSQLCEALLRATGKWIE